MSRPLLRMGGRTVSSESCFFRSVSYSELQTSRRKKRERSEAEESTPSRVQTSSSKRVGLVCLIVDNLTNVT